MQTQQTQLQKDEVANEQAIVQIQNLQLETSSASEEVQAMKDSIERGTRQIKEHSTTQSHMENHMQHMQDMLATLMASQDQSAGGDSSRNRGGVATEIVSSCLGVLCWVRFWSFDMFVFC